MLEKILSKKDYNIRVIFVICSKIYYTKENSVVDFFVEKMGIILC